MENDGKNDKERIGQLPQKVTDIYNLDDSYDSLLPQQRNNQQGKNFNQKSGTTSGGQTAATSRNNYFGSRGFAGSYALDPESQNQAQIEASARKKQTLSGQNALLSLISMDDFEGIRNQIHSKIRDKIDEIASEEDEDQLNASGMNANMADEVVNESPFNARLKKRRAAATASKTVPQSDN